MFGEIYEPVQRYVRRRADASAVDDVVAEVLLVVWRRLDDLPDDAAVPWAYAIARRCLSNQRRSARRSERLTLRVATAAPTVPQDDNDSADPMLATALGTLSDEDRELLRLWAWEQLRPAEIASVLGITANAVSIRLHRAKGRLAKELGVGGKIGGVDGHTPEDEEEERG